MVSLGTRRVRRESRVDDLKASEEPHSEYGTVIGIGEHHFFLIAPCLFLTSVQQISERRTHVSVFRRVVG